MFQLFRRLQEFALAQRRFLLADQPRFHLLELVEEIAQFGDQIAYDREIAQRLHADLVSVAAHTETGRSRKSTWARH